MDVNSDTIRRALRDAEAHHSRQHSCRVFAASIQACGDVLWAFGIVEEPFRRALAMTLQMAGRLATGAAALLESENWYAAGALVRQLIESEYLLFRFVSDRSEAETWLSATPNEIRIAFGPGAMRKRSGTRFRVEEYAAHCEHGGHPNPRASFLLPEHAVTDQMIPFGSFNWLWVDLAQHLARIVQLMATAIETAGLAHVGLARRAINDAQSALTRWETEDVLATLKFSVPEDARKTGV
jgi:hypothetical protein